MLVLAMQFSRGVTKGALRRTLVSSPEELAELKGPARPASVKQRALLQSGTEDDAPSAWRPGGRPTTCRRARGTMSECINWEFSSEAEVISLERR